MSCALIPSLSELWSVDEDMSCALIPSLSELWSVDGIALAVSMLCDNGATLTIISKIDYMHERKVNISDL